MMNAARIYGAVGLMMLMGVVIGGAALHFLQDATGISNESSLGEPDKQELLDGLASSHILYFKMEDYVEDRIIPGTAEPPDSVIIEHWWRPETSQKGELTLGTTRDTDGRLLEYTVASDGEITTTFVSSGESMERNFDEPSPMEWVEDTWEWPRRLASHDQGEFQGIGELNGKATLIYDVSSDSTRNRWELVEHAPLLRRISTFLIDDQDRERLVGEQTVVGYRLLPIGSSVPRLP